MRISGSQLLRDISFEDLADMVDGNPGLKSPFIGYIAEHWLRKHLEALDYVEQVEKIPDRSYLKGDFKVTMINGASFSVEAKCVSKHREDPIMKDSVLNLTLKSSDRSFPGEAEEEGTMALQFGQFDILAICDYQDPDWKFWFINASRLDRHEKHPDRLKTNLNITPGLTPFLYEDFLQSLA